MIHSFPSLHIVLIRYVSQYRVTGSTLLIRQRMSSQPLNHVIPRVLFNCPLAELSSTPHVALTIAFSVLPTLPSPFLSNTIAGSPQLRWTSPSTSSDLPPCSSPSLFPNFTPPILALAITAAPHLPLAFTFSQPCPYLNYITSMWHRDNDCLFFALQTLRTQCERRRQ